MLRYEVKVAFYDLVAKLRLKIMTFMSHMPSPMLDYALNTIYRVTQKDLNDF